ncbi:hypothetical protein CDAR_45011 [Caerostris darwini]|uniref:Uncharacterized protein n=1 Tax=Caerostris darwini TaxID=1538125 RepID=A0AAV4UXB8_9ARAC|nr:hypothetical protein CDAR_45011 [Caerostris darwini]
MPLSGACASPSTTLVHKFKCRPKGTSILLSKQCPYCPGKESALGEDNRDRPCRKMWRVPVLMRGNRGFRSLGREKYFIPLIETGDKCFGKEMISRLMDRLGIDGAS